MRDTIRHMARTDALRFLDCAYDGRIPADLDEFARSLPLVIGETARTWAEQRAAIWSDIRSTWRGAGSRGSDPQWQQRRRHTSRLLEDLAEVRRAEQIADEIEAAASRMEGISA